MAVLSRLPGYGYTPTDQQIFSLLEKLKVHLSHLEKLKVDFSLPKKLEVVKKLMDEYNGHIHICNLFGHESEPSEIWKLHGGDQTHGQQLFFLSELKRSLKNFSRKIGRHGTWSGSGPKKTKGNTNPNPNGRIRNFRFENKRMSEDDGRWFLEEYSLYDAAAAHDNPKASKNHYDFDYVICKMKRNPSEKKTKLSNDPNTNNVEEPQMAETLEDGPMRSVGSAWQGGPLQNHYPLAYPALDSDHYQMDGNQEEQQPLPTLTTAGPACLDECRAIEACLHDECGGAIEAGYLIPSNYDDMLNEVPYEEGTSNYSPEVLNDIQLWSYQH